MYDNNIHVTNPKIPKVKLKVNFHKALNVMSLATGFYYNYSPHLYVMEMLNEDPIQDGKDGIPTHSWKNDGKVYEGSQVLSPKSLEVNPCNLIHWEHGSWDFPFSHKVSVVSLKYSRLLVA